jgi:hypothetical protein
VSDCTLFLRHRMSALLLIVTAAVQPFAEAVAEPRPVEPRATRIARSAPRPSTETNLGTWSVGRMAIDEKNIAMNLTARAVPGMLEPRHPFPW